MLHQTTDQSAFSLGIAYANQFDMWGSYGVAADLTSAVLTYDRSPNRKGPGFTLNGKLLYIPDDSPDDAGLMTGTTLQQVNINDKGDDKNWFDGVVQFVAQNGLGILDRAGTYTEALGFAGSKSGLVEFAGENALKFVTNAVGVVVITDDVMKSYNAFRSGNWQEGTWQGLKAVGTGAFMYFGGAEYQGAKLLWNLGSLLIDDARGK
jgi:hypothetical protein